MSTLGIVWNPSLLHFFVGYSLYQKAITAQQLTIDTSALFPVDAVILCACWHEVGSKLQRMLNVGSLAPVPVLQFQQYPLLLSNEQFPCMLVNELELFWWAWCLAQWWVWGRTAMCIGATRHAANASVLSMLPSYTGPLLSTKKITSI